MTHRNWSDRKQVLLFPVTLMSCLILAAGTLWASCPDQNRKKMINAGAQNHQTVACGNEMTCIFSYENYIGSVWTCEGALKGYACNPNGKTVTVWHYADGKCIARISEQGTVYYTCQAPIQQTEGPSYENSATLSACEN